MRALYDAIADRVTDLHVSASKRPALAAIVILVGVVVLAAAAFTLFRGDPGGVAEPARAGQAFVACSSGYCLKQIEAPRTCGVGQPCRIRIEGSRPTTGKQLQITLGAMLTGQLKTSSTGLSWIAEGSFRCLTPTPPSPVAVRVSGGAQPVLLASKATIECSAGPAAP